MNVDYNAIPKKISIHALMKRATDKMTTGERLIKISIHALMKRATMTLFLFVIISNNFNPRPHEEGDTIDRQSKPSKVISIHALMKRATDSPFSPRFSG